MAGSDIPNLASKYPEPGPSINTIAVYMRGRSIRMTREHIRVLLLLLFL